MAHTPQPEPLTPTDQPPPRKDDPALPPGEEAPDVIDPASPQQLPPVREPGRPQPVHR